MLNLISNQIKEIVPGSFEGLEFLKYLDLTSNNINIESIDKTVFDKLKCLFEGFKYYLHFTIVLFCDYLKNIVY